MGNDRTERKAVFALNERGDKTFFARIGIAFCNRDGSITCKVDALPVSGTFQIRDEESRGERDREQDGGRDRDRSARDRANREDRAH